MLRNLGHHIPLLLVLALTPLLVGARCTFFFSSGDDSDSEDRDEDRTIVVRTGSFGDPPVEGLSFASGALSGITDSGGGFHYEQGGRVRFSIGEIPLGDAVAGADLITAKDLVAEADAGKAAAVNISRLLLSLDADPDDSVITLPATVRTAAVRNNASVAAAIDGLDFADETAFVNAASHLVAVLTHDYPFTAMLVDAAQVPLAAQRQPSRD